MLIKTIDGLRKWLDDMESEHQRVDDYRCSCGWDGTVWPGEDHPVQAHIDGFVIARVMDVIPSGHMESGGHEDTVTETFEWYDQVGENSNALIDADHDLLYRIMTVPAEEPGPLIAAYFLKVLPHGSMSRYIKSAGLDVAPPEQVRMYPADL